MWAPRPDGGVLHAAFSDVFTFRDGRACVVESYVVPLSGEQFAAVSEPRVVEE
ncbi:MAG: hypothetical protein ACRDYU_01825 [Actinomycetes bacterium]